MIRRILVSGTRAFSLFLNRLSRRGEAGFSDVEESVRSIIAQVRRNGDTALLRLTRKYDRWPATPKRLIVSRREMAAAWKGLPGDERDALTLSAERIERFHALQRQSSWSFAEENGNILGQIVRPMERVGIYVPGGKAAYPSSVLMNAIPARVAGVPGIFMACPAPGGDLNPAVLAAAYLCGVEKVYKVGGAQAIAALAYGTRLVPKVDKIVGPGNRYVATAKRLVFGEVSIDSVAGPSEILIISDGSGDPSFLAADLLSQAEHDEEAAAILICTSKAFAQKVQREVLLQLAVLPRKEIAAQSLRKFGAILLVKTLSDATGISNRLAPEHLELAVADPFRLVSKIQNAGAIFLGSLSPEAIGDYVAGPNHVLPTGGTARFSSPLGVYDFLKRSSLICVSPRGYAELGPAASRLARMEGFEGHRNSITRRQKNNPRNE
jgi:histidinol dehydrogenase